MDLDEIINCRKCGVLLNKSRVLKLTGHSCLEGKHTYEGVCPVCNILIEMEW